MTGPLGQEGAGMPAAGGPAAAGPLPPAGGSPVDVVAILAAMQDQIDDLTAAVEAQQRTIDELVRGQRPSGAARRPGAPGPRR
jgi:hypothetical protein